MTSQNNLEIKGTLLTHPFAELLAESFAANLSGSFRLSREGEKIVVYLNAGKPVFAVSNARRHRLFEILLQTNGIDKKRLIEIPNFTKDADLAEALKSGGLISKDKLDELMTLQIKEILKTAFAWTDGEWIFSPLIRVKEGICYNVEFQKLLLEYARSLPKEKIVRRFKSFNETFGANPSADLSLELLPQEAFILSRVEKTFMKVEDVKFLSGLPDTVTMQLLYSLWLGGFLYRENWNPAFPDRKISEINSARLALKKEEESDVQKKAAIFSAAKPPVLKSQPPQPVAGPIVKQTEEKPLELSLEEYLERAENSVSYYEFFDISPDAEISAIKRVYFFFAKRFHPDRFHQETDADLLQRIQNAFSLAAQAYEILKDEDKRRTYDLKLRKHLEDLRFKDISSKTQKTDREELAKEAFDQGFNLLMEDEIDEALPYLARAVQFAPKNARYHAYYGKALSFDENQRFKADTEMQTAVRLDPQNATYRIILAEFYIYYELFKRAEGELQRLLAIYPDNEEARMLLDSLPKK